MAARLKRDPRAATADGTRSSPAAAPSATRSAARSGAAAPAASSTSSSSEAAGPVVERGCPSYWDEARADLIKRDRILRRLIPKHPDGFLVSRGDPFVTLARAITGQQISVQSAQLVWDRVAVAVPRMTPATVLKAGHATLLGCGLSRRKCEYILDLAAKIKEREVHPDRWNAMGDEDVIVELVRIRGIGRWTAEMFLIFNLLRPDVLPLDDVGLLKAISLHYFSGEPVSRQEAREVAENWQPWRTVATWYLWRSLDPLPVDY